MPTNSDTKPGAKLHRPDYLPSPIPVLLADLDKNVSLLGIDDALDLFRSYLRLPGNEQERVYNLMQDAVRRLTDPAEEADHRVLESLFSWRWGVRRGESAETICHQLSITPRQHRQYKRAWRIVARLHKAAEKQAEAEYQRHLQERQAKEGGA